MNDRPVDSTIDVAQLRVGMFVHLDLGWMSHPFPLSSFKITTDDQLATIQKLGLQTVRWSPHKSDLTPTDAPQALQTPLSPTAATPVVSPASDKERARQALLDALAVQRATLAMCEKQYAEAAREYHRVIETAAREPKQANAQAQMLTRALLDKMLVEGDMCIRLLNEGASDRTTAHALNVSIISMLMGRAFGLNEQDMLDLGAGSLLHDLGKQELPARLRMRDDFFTAPEMKLYQQHVEKGIELATKMGVSPGVMLVIAQHHENADGSGFPKKLLGDRMSAAARIVALVNRYDGLCNPAQLGKALTPHEALSLLFAQGRARYDATMLNTFIRMMGVYPPGSTVQLTDDRYAMVVSVNSTRPLKPSVMVHTPGVPRKEALVLSLEDQPDLGIRRSLRPAQLPTASMEYLAPRARVAYFFEPQGLREASPEEVCV